MPLRRPHVVLSLFSAVALSAGCSCSNPPGNGDGSIGRPDGAARYDGMTPDAVGSDGARSDAGPPPVPQEAELWYSVDDLLIHIEIDPDDGSVAALTASRLIGDVPVGQNAITMLADGSLLFARLDRIDFFSHFFHVPTPPDDDADVTPIALGVMPDELMIEGLYSDCEGRVYAMDTGENDGSSAGNRLLRFTGDVLQGDFTYAVVSDLSTADVADIDDMSPGIVDGEISDNPGLAIDTGSIYAFDYQTGSGTPSGAGGTWGIHALGGALFSDGRARLYVLSSAAELYEIDPVDFTLSGVLVTGPTPDEGTAGWSGLAGPLTECDSGFILL